MELYEKNKELLKSKDSYLTQIIEELEKQEKEWNEQEVFIDFSQQNEPILRVDFQGHSWYLNSRYEAWEAAKKCVSGYRKLGYEGTYIVFGLGNGMYIKAIREINPEAFIIVYEPSMDITRLLMEQVDLSFLFEDENCVLCVGKEGFGDYTVFVEQRITMATYDNIELILVPNYERLFYAEWLKFQIQYWDAKRILTMSRNTAVNYLKAREKNARENYFDAINQYSIASIKKQMENVDKAIYPAIIVSAGPSLDKNIHQLKAAKGKCFIIVVDTALKAVLKAGIMPDISVSVAPEKPMNLFENKIISEIPMVVPITVTGEIKEIHHGKRFYFSEAERYLEYLYSLYEKTLMPLNTGGSVANNAFSLAVTLGFKTIILVGQDLAFTDDKLHTNVAYEKGEEDPLGTTLGSKFLVEDIHGGQVYTEPALDLYRKWFEKQISVYSKGLRVIDATEGGAKIKGTEILTLQEALERECLNNKVIDFEKIVEDCHPTFNETEVAELKQKLMNMPQCLDEINEELEKIYDTYKKMEELNEKRDYMSTDFKLLLEKVKVNKEWMEENAEISLIISYAVKDELDIMRGAYDNATEDVYENVKYVAEQGKELISSYQKALGQLKEDWKGVLKSIGEVHE